MYTQHHLAQQRNSPLINLPGQYLSAAAAAAAAAHHRMQALAHCN